MLSVTGFNVNVLFLWEGSERKLWLFLGSKVNFFLHSNEFCAYRSLALLKLVVAATLWYVWPCSIIGFVLDKSIVQPNKREWHRGTHFYNPKSYHGQTSVWSKPTWFPSNPYLYTVSMYLSDYMYGLTLHDTFPLYSLLWESKISYTCKCGDSKLLDRIKRLLTTSGKRRT
jgi:hypothetical protein